MISLAIAAAAVLMICIVACGKQSDKDQEVKTFIEILDDGGAAAHFDKTEKGTAGGTGLTIKEGDYLAIDTELTAGKVHVRVISGGSDINTPPTEEKDKPATIDYVFEDSGTTEYMMIKPGDYFFTVEVEEKATGTITAYMKPLPAEESSGSTESAAKPAASSPAADK